jgi:hypothetical protein
MERRGLGAVKRVAYFEYDFARDGGVVGDISLRGEGLPKGAIVTDGKIHVLTAVTSGGAATVALRIVGANDTLTATAKASLSLAAILDIVPVRTAATSILVATEGTGMVATVATAALTAGKFIVAVEYY